ncbi:MAG: phosphotransferase [Anaerolineae bacterium]|nr:phosphotransferase [Anaerolineae bacterium]
MTDIPQKGRLIAQGRTAEIYAWGEGSVVKLFFDWCPDSLVQHEVEMGRVLSTTALPTPKLLGSVEVEGRRGLLYERVDGPSMVRAMTTQPWRLAQLAAQFAELHAAVHRQKGEGFPPLRAQLTWTIEHTDLPPELKAHALATLDRLADGDTLCHLDFHPDQVILTPAGPVVLDWMTAGQGNPLADVARTVILLRVGQLPYGGWLQRAFINAARRLFLRTYLRRYRQLHPGLTQAAIDAWIIPLAAARVKEDNPGERDQLLAFLQRSLPTH